MTRLYSQRRRFATVAALCLTTALGYHVISGQNGLTAYEKKKQDALVLEQQMRLLSEENEILKGHVDRLEHDPGAIEHQAREALRYTRPGEVIVTLAPEPTISGSPAH
jgi:cell division protein FtsB